MKNSKYSDIQIEIFIELVHKQKKLLFFFELGDRKINLHYICVQVYLTRVF